eukprot:m51a1_g11425 hypothetical protein (131) ;mRNA; r:15085-15884
MTDSDWNDKVRRAARNSWFHRVSQGMMRALSPTHVQVAPAADEEESLVAADNAVPFAERRQAKLRSPPSDQRARARAFDTLTPAEAEKVRVQIRAELYELQQSGKPEAEIKPKVAALQAELRAISAVCDQ